MQEMLTVSELNAYISSILENNINLQEIWIKGEISGLRLYQQSGHLYFTLKDNDSTVSCVMFKSRVNKLDFQPEDGLEIILRGSISVYSRQGRYQLYVEEIQAYGLGGIYLQLEQLKQKLNSLGYFDSINKKAIPVNLKRLGVVSSQDGAALKDIIKVARSLNPSVEIIIAHTSVQGIEAPIQIASAIELLNEYLDIDLMIVGRGGGSFEDLMAFNSEIVVKAIFESQIPVISAVGHEVDYTLADMVADIRAATPTQAAQLAIKDVSSIYQDIQKKTQRIWQLIDRKILESAEYTDRIMMSKVWQEPYEVLIKKQDLLTELKKDLLKDFNQQYREKQNNFMLKLSRLNAHNPLTIMAKGYMYLKKEDQIIEKVEDVDIGDVLTAELKNGKLNMKVIHKEIV